MKRNWSTTGSGEKIIRTRKTSTIEDGIIKTKTGTWGDILMAEAIPKDILFPKIKKPACKVIIVSGPPGSGKSSYIDKYKRPDDIVLDLDEITARISGCPIYTADIDKWLIPALKERNKILGELCNENKKKIVWFVISAAGTQWLWWKRALNPIDTHVCTTPMNVCIDRIKADKRRINNLERHIIACKRWFELERKSINYISNNRAYAAQNDFEEEI